MPEIFGPNGSVDMDGEFITVDSEGNVWEHKELSQLPDQHQAQLERTSVPHAEFKMTIKGSAPLSQLVRIADQYSPNSQYPAQPQQVPIFMQQPAPYPYPQQPQPSARPYDDGYEGPTEPIPIQYDTPRSRNKSWHLADEDEFVEEVTSYKKRISKRAIAISALVAVGLVAGPATQLAYGGGNAAEICAKDGITSILGNPGCFGDQVVKIAFNPKNFLNIVPPQQQKVEQKK